MINQGGVEMRIAIIEDDEITRLELSKLLNTQGYETVLLTDFGNLTDELKQYSIELVLLDIMLPKESGLTILKKLKESMVTKDIPVIMVTSKNTEMDEVISMSFGADDFIAKPYNPSILLLHIEAVFKRLGKMDADKGLTYKNMTLDTARGVLTVGDNSVELTKNEFRILKLLMENSGRIVSRENLITRLWESDEFIDDNTLTVNVARLRKKLEEIGAENWIQTKKGIGYIVE